MEISKTEFGERFPALHHEIFEEKQSQTLKIDEVQGIEAINMKEGPSEEKLNENTEGRIRSKVPDPLNRYSPSVEDFLARADTDEEALAVIDYLQRRGEISLEKARGFQAIIRQKGIRALGPKRTPGYYDRFAREERTRKQMERRVMKKEEAKK
ncbi:MAG: DUF2095 family protein [Candidatus Hodarchaeota archaeon]